MGEVLDLLENETVMHFCLEAKPKLAGWRRRQEEASPWRRVRLSTLVPLPSRKAASMSRVLSPRANISTASRSSSAVRPATPAAVSQVTERLWQEYEAFAGRDLSEFVVAYLFVDGVAERLHAGLPREAVLCAWGVTDAARRSCSTWRPARRRIRRAARRFSKTSSAGASPTRCWSSRTVPPG